MLGPMHRNHAHHLKRIPVSGVFVPDPSCVSPGYEVKTTPLAHRGSQDALYFSVAKRQSNTLQHRFSTLGGWTYRIHLVGTVSSKFPAPFYNLHTARHTLHDVHSM